MARREKTLKVVKCKKQPNDDSIYAFIPLLIWTGTLIVIRDYFTSLSPSWILALLCAPQCPQLSSGAPCVSWGSAAAPILLACSPLPIFHLTQGELSKCTAVCATPCWKSLINTPTLSAWLKPTVSHILLSQVTRVHSHRSSASHVEGTNWPQTQSVW